MVLWDESANAAPMSATLDFKMEFAVAVTLVAKVVHLVRME